MNCSGSEPSVNRRAFIVRCKQKPSEATRAAEVLYHIEPTDTGQKKQRILNSLAKGQAHGEYGTGTGRAGGFNIPAMRGNNGLTNRESQSGAAAASTRLVSPIKPLEYMR